MTSRALIRLALIVALVVTAHALRPITGQSIATHILDTVESISVVLPESTAAQLAQANYIAAAFGRGLIEAESPREGVWKRPATMFAVAQPEPPIKTRLGRAASKPAAKSGKVSRPAGRARNLLAGKYRPLIQPVDLPAAMPFSPTLAFNLAPVNVTLLRMPAYQFSRRIARPSRFVVKPAILTLPRKKAECETEMPAKPGQPTRTRIADEVEAPMEAPMAEGPMEAEAFGLMLDAELKSVESEPKPAHAAEIETVILPPPVCDTIPSLLPFNPRR